MKKIYRDETSWAEVTLTETGRLDVRFVTADEDPPESMKVHADPGQRLDLVLWFQGIANAVAATGAVSDRVECAHCHEEVFTYDSRIVDGEVYCLRCPGVKT